VAVPAELHQRGVDFDGVHPLGALVQGHRHVVAGARADDEYVLA